MKIRDFIVGKAEDLYRELGAESLIEIGLGKGVMTKKLYKISEQFFIIEMDKSLAFMWEKKCEDGEKMGTVICGDVLDVDVEGIWKEKNLDIEKTVVVGNLPYYITSPIFRKFFEWLPRDTRYDGRFPGGIFMIQDEVALKLKSDADKKSYLWRLINYGYEVTYLKGVPAKFFKPAPNVKSAVIKIKRKEKLPNIDFFDFKSFLELYAPYSRKTLGAIQKIVNKHACKSQQIMIDEFVISDGLLSKRLEELCWNDIEKIFN